jgi:hypothetical protein
VSETTASPAEAFAPRSDREVLEVIGTALALAALLLPASGYALRFAAFVPLGLDTDSQWPYILAGSTSLAILAVDGLFSSVIAAGLLWSVYVAPTILIHPAVRTHTLGQRQSRVAIAILFAALALLAVFTPFFPFVLLLSLPNLILGAVVGYRAARHQTRLRFREIWWVLVIVLLGGAAGLGLGGGLGSTPGDYQFKSDAHVVAPDGRYDQLGEANGFSYLIQCGTKHLVVMKDEEIVAITPAARGAHASGPSLFDILFQGRPVRVGYQPC